MFGEDISESPRLPSPWQAISSSLPKSSPVTGGAGTPSSTSSRPTSTTAFHHPSHSYNSTNPNSPIGHDLIVRSGVAGAGTNKSLRRISTSSIPGLNIGGRDGEISLGSTDDDVVGGTAGILGCVAGDGALVGSLGTGGESLSVDMSRGLTPEVDSTGHIEYKLKLLPTTYARFQKLVTQLKWRLLEGGGLAIYEIGVLDDGTLIGLNEKDALNSLETLARMAGELGAKVKVVREIVLEGDGTGTGSGGGDDKEARGRDSATAQNVRREKVRKKVRVDANGVPRPPPQAPPKVINPDELAEDSEVDVLQLELLRLGQTADLGKYNASSGQGRRGGRGMRKKSGGGGDRAEEAKNRAGGRRKKKMLVFDEYEGEDGEQMVDDGDRIEAEGRELSKRAVRRSERKRRGSSGDGLFFDLPPPTTTDLGNAEGTSGSAPATLPMAIGKASVVPSSANRARGDDSTDRGGRPSSSTESPSGSSSGFESSDGPSPLLKDDKEGESGDDLIFPEFEVFGFEGLDVDAAQGPTGDVGVTSGDGNGQVGACAGSPTSTRKFQARKTTVRRDELSGITVSASEKGGSRMKIGKGAEEMSSSAEDLVDLIPPRQTSQNGAEGTRMGNGNAGAAVRVPLPRTDSRSSTLVPPSKTPTSISPGSRSSTSRASGSTVTHGAGSETVAGAPASIPVTHTDPVEYADDNPFSVSVSGGPARGAGARDGWASKSRRVPPVEREEPRSGRGRRFSDDDQLCAITPEERSFMKKEKQEWRAKRDMERQATVTTTTTAAAAVTATTKKQTSQASTTPKESPPPPGEYGSAVPRYVAGEPRYVIEVLVYRETAGGAVGTKNGDEGQVGGNEDDGDVDDDDKASNAEDGEAEEEEEEEDELFGGLDKKPKPNPRKTSMNGDEKRNGRRARSAGNKLGSNARAEVDDEKSTAAVEVVSFLDFEGFGRSAVFET